MKTLEEQREYNRQKSKCYYQTHKRGLGTCIYCGNTYTKTNNKQTCCSVCRDKINNFRKVSDDIEYHRTSDHSTVHRNLMRQNGWHVTKDDVVHHLDGDRRNNDIGNLLLLNCKDHAKLHHFIAVERFKGSKESVRELSFRFLIDTQSCYGIGKYPTDDEIDDLINKDK